MLYPPKFEVLVIRSSAAEDSFVDIKFQGATQEIVKRLQLTKGTLYSPHDVDTIWYHEASMSM